MDQRQWEQLKLWTPFLGEQPLDEWVIELEALITRDLWLDKSYRALQFHTVVIYPLFVEHKGFLGEDYNGPCLLWEEFDNGMAFGDLDSSHFWYIRDEQEDSLGLKWIREMQPDLTFLANWKWELEQDYARPFSRVSMWEYSTMPLLAACGNTAQCPVW
ncbi:Hypothetical predicted protein, partial [Pelobates cultripes]